MSEINEVQQIILADNPTIETTGWPWPHFPSQDDPSVGVDQQTYDNLVRYTKYASGAYQVLCPRPMGNRLVVEFQSFITGAKGFIARDDNRKEFIVSFRGSLDVANMLLDTCIILVSLQGCGLPPSVLPEDSGLAGPLVHSGFLIAYNSIAETVLDELASHLREHSTYNIVVCGHSLGGAIASIAAVAINYTFPRRPITLYTFGQPRVGDRVFAELVERVIGTDRTYRCVHTVDGVPTMIPTQLGYRHFGAEYWEFAEQGSPKNVKRFETGEDPNGSCNIPSTGINPAHLVYFQQSYDYYGYVVIALDPTVCI